MLRTIVLSGAIAFVVTTGPSLADAESGQDVGWRKGEGSPTSEQRTRGGAALIEAGATQGRDLALSYFRRAAAYLKRQDYDDAIHDFGEGIALDPNNATAYYGRGPAHEPKSDPDRAILDYGAAIKLDPGHVKALSNRGAIYADQRAYERALEDNNRVIELEPGQAQGFVNRA